MQQRIVPAREAYDLVAPVYDAWCWNQFWERNEQPLLEKCISDENPALAIDIGCGTGKYSRILERRSATVGIDPSLKMLEVARCRASGNTRLIAARARRLPLPASIVGLAVAARSLSHEIALDEAMEEVARTMVRGGLFVVSDVDRGHDYPCTRIPFGDAIVQIETYKRTSLDIIVTAERTGKWGVELVREVRWKELEWKPTDDRFHHGIRESDRYVFFVVALRRR